MVRKVLGTSFVLIVFIMGVSATLSFRLSFTRVSWTSLGAFVCYTRFKDIIFSACVSNVVLQVVLCVVLLVCLCVCMGVLYQGR